jgi:beta-galactosidase
MRHLNQVGLTLCVLVLLASRCDARATERFDADWKFHLGDQSGAQSPDFNDSSWRTLNLPHDWSIEQPFDPKLASGTGFLPGGVGWYRKHFDLPTLRSGLEIHVRFDGAYMNSRVWINGHDLGIRPNGFVSFEYDLTPYLQTTGNTLAVRVDHSEDADSRFYTGSGIYRDVWLITTSDVHIDSWGVYLTTPLARTDSATVTAQTTVHNQSDQAKAVTLVSRIEDTDGVVIARAESPRTIEAKQRFDFQQKFSVLFAHLWSCNDPYLYRVVSMVNVDGQTVDQITTPLGIRSIAFDADQGFLLNGNKVLIKGICLHQDAGAFGAAVPPEEFARRLRLLKELGCNAIRTSHNPPSPVLLDLCDQLGFLVMDEAFDEWARPKKKWVAGRNQGKPSFQGYSEYFKDSAVSDIQSMVQRDRNHPSVILWSIGNEVDYDKDPYFDPRSTTRPSAAELPAIARTLADAVKAVDPTRPVTAALANVAVSNRTGLADVLDVAGYNYQEQFYSADHARYPARKIIGSENSHAYTAWEAVRDLPYAAGQFLWTGFDYLGEAPLWPMHGSPSGVFEEGDFKKPSFYFRQSLWSDEPMVYLAVRQPGPATRGRFDRRFQGEALWSAQPGQRITVVCYSNCLSVELLLNGKSLGIRDLPQAFDGVRSWQVAYAPGTLKAVGMTGATPVCSCRLTTPGKPDHLRLRPEETTIGADGSALAFVPVEVLDADNNLVYANDAMIHFAVSGPAKIRAVDSGDLASRESFQADHRRAYHGRCLLIIQSQTQTGTIEVTASSDGLIGDHATILSIK